jgi:hypothetical protein
MANACTTAYKRNLKQKKSLRMTRDPLRSRQYLPPQARAAGMGQTVPKTEKDIVETTQQKAASPKNDEQQK